MGTSYNPRIVTDGLVLCFDAANARSYPGTGTTWTDLKGGNNATLVNGPTFDSNNNGYIVFDGSNDYINFHAPNLNSTATVELFTILPSTYSNKMIFGWSRYDVWCRNGGMGYNTANSDLYGISNSSVSNLGLVDNWKHYVFEMRSDVSYTNNKIYIETELQSLSQESASEYSSYRNFNNGDGIISSWRYNASYVMALKLSYFRVYNRALTADEIRQNYLAAKERYA